MPDYKDLYFWLLNKMSEIRQKLESVEKNAERLRLLRGIRFRCNFSKASP